MRVMSRDGVASPSYGTSVGPCGLGPKYGGGGGLVAQLTSRAASTYHLRIHPMVAARLRSFDGDRRPGELAALHAAVPSLTFDRVSAPDRSWTVAPTLLWFGGLLAVGLYVLDGGVQAIADRLTSPREPTPTGGAAGPAFTAQPPAVAEAGNEDDDKPGLPVASTGRADRAKGRALEDTCLDGTPDRCKRWAMDAYYKAVADEKAGALGRAVRVSWYGDSVVATDAIPGRLRTRLQAALGDGGPGFVALVPPHRFVGHEAITRGSSGNWATHAISTLQVADGLYGAGGATAEGDDARATIKLVAGTVTNLDLHYLTQPRGGSVVITADGTEVVRADTRADAKEAKYAAATLKDGASTFKIEITGRVRTFGLQLENPRGAVVDNLGIVSVNVKSFANHNPASFEAGLAHRGADLIMIMIGANEAQWLGPSDRDTKLYQANYEKVLGPLRKARPEASCLVVSPTDQAEAKDGGYPSRPVMPVLVDAQRRAAHATGCAFFSTYDWMGGKGSAEKWFRKGLVGTDFQHLSHKGANKLADAVFDALSAGAQNDAVR